MGVAKVEAPITVSSAWIDEQLAETYQRVKIRPGLLEDLAGITERRWWDAGVSFAEAASLAATAVLNDTGISVENIDMLISTSVCKPHLEPSVACDVHNRLRLPARCINFDIGNACLGFINAIHVAAAMVDSGAIRYALIVDGEGSRHTQEVTLQRLQRPETTGGDIFAEFASLTLGSGAAAMIIGSLEDNPNAHTIIGGVSRAATEHNLLCVGDLDKMTTDTAALLAAGLDLAEAAWLDATATFSWASTADWYILHQVSKVHTESLAGRLGIDLAQVPLTYPLYGNIGPASVPFTLATASHQFTPGQKIICMGIGSGLNVKALEVQW